MKGSVIIPTYRRPLKTVEETLASLLDLGAELQRNVFEIFVVDQNSQHLQFSESIISRLEKSGVKLHHLKRDKPSVTKAKNQAMQMAQGDLYFFFDDDVEVQLGCLDAFRSFFNEQPKAGFLGGRELLAYGKTKEDQKVGRLKKLVYSFIRPFVSAEYLSQNGRPVGLIYKSFFFCDFDQDNSGHLTKIHTARGCNWALRASSWNKSQDFFDTHYSGTALREESDAYMRLKLQGWEGYYCADAVAIHKRQAGGCENLSQSLGIYTSKLNNEAYFQSKYFGDVPRALFFLRTLSHLVRLPMLAWPKAFWIGARTALTLDKPVLKFSAEPKG